MRSLKELFASFHGSKPRPALETISGSTMGTRYRIKFDAGGGPVDPLLHQTIQIAIDAVDAEMSTWKPRSALSRFNASTPGHWFGVPPDLATVVALSLEISEISCGAFDISVGDLVDAWGFGPQRLRQSGRPRPSARRLPNFRDIEVDLSRSALRKSAPVSLDLSGVAKGFGVDIIASTLECYGVFRYAVEIDGEVRTRGTKSDGTPWMIGLERPEAEGRSIAQALKLETDAVATSGDYRHFFDEDGIRYSHTIDPRTGEPTRSAVASVTVADQTCARADALATALLVMGHNDGPAFAHKHGISAFFFIRDGNSLIERVTGDFERFRQS